MPKSVTFFHEAREALRRGLEPFARAVKVTLGPAGRLVILEKKWGSPTVTKDGVTVAKEIDLEDPEADMGAQLLKEVAEKTQKDAGDGTTTAVVLAEAIFMEGIKYLSSGHNAQEMARGMKAATAAAVEYFAKKSKPVSGIADMKAVATSAANNDPVVGGLVAEAYQKVGKDGVITIEETESVALSWTWAEGMEFDRGFASPYFITNRGNLSCELDNPYILIHEDKIDSLKPLVPLLEKVYRAGKPLLIIAEVIEGEALTGLVVNHLNGVLKACAVKAPGYGDRRKEMLEDIAVLTGGRAIMKDIGRKLESLTLADLGRAKRVVVTKDDCKIIGGAGKPEDIKGRVAQLKAQHEESDSSYDREKLQERIAKLAGGVARIDIGAATESATKELKQRVEDAVSATKAALEEGILPGGGIPLIRARKAIKELKLSPEQSAGAEIIVRALDKPLIQIVMNAGLRGEVVAEKVGEMKENEGFNVLTREYEDLMKAGVLDAAKVVRVSLQNASSLASLLLTSDALIAKIPEEEKAPPMPDMDDYDEY